MPSPTESAPLAVQGGLRPMLCPEPLVPEVHRNSGFRLVLATSPLEQPPRLRAASIVV